MASAALALALLLGLRVGLRCEHLGFVFGVLGDFMARGDGLRLLVRKLVRHEVALSDEGPLAGRADEGPLSSLQTDKKEVFLTCDRRWVFRFPVCVNVRWHAMYGHI